MGAAQFPKTSRKPSRQVQFGAVSDKKHSRPVWWKNTYFWIGGLLVVVAIVGLFAGDGSIRDPGQKREGGLVWFYAGAAALMIINGLVSHWQTLRHYEELVSGGDDG